MMLKPGLFHMNALKRWLIILLVVVLSLSMTACSIDVDGSALVHFFELWALANGFMNPHTGEIFFDSPGYFAAVVTGRHSDDPLMEAAADMHDIAEDIKKSGSGSGRRL